MHAHAQPGGYLARFAFHGKAAMTTNAPSIGWIDRLEFKRRKESWVAESAGRFYKIVRKSDDPRRDLDDAACIAIATREYMDLRFLHALDDAVCRPERIDRACVIYPSLSGPDLRTLLLDAHSAEVREASLHSAMRLLAHLHHGDAAGYPVKDYLCDGFLAPSPAVLARMCGRTRVLVVTGFEARNFRFDERRGAWCFFDPHHVWRGFPEEDFARFLVSLLTLRGRRSGPRPWVDFDRFRLLAAYEALAPARLDTQLLNYFLHEGLAMRRFHALRSAHGMAPVARPFGEAYTRFYYRRMRRALAAQHF